jgi:hypothetical protein
MAVVLLEEYATCEVNQEEQSAMGGRVREMGKDGEGFDANGNGDGDGHPKGNTPDVQEAGTEF